MTILHIIATICSLSDPSQCREQEVTNDQFADVSMQTCMLGSPALAEWMASHPGYRLMKWSCQLGERKIAS